MRHIKQSELLAFIPEGWLQRAQEKLEELEKLPEASRSKFINDNAALWSELKGHMARLSHTKCWYSEIRIAQSELEVDHFRPKNKVTASKPPHSGYWWLAFDWRNYRLAYSLINKRRRDIREDEVSGKGCYFPLREESTRASHAAADISGEEPRLLDPCIKSDVELLGYTVETGKIVEGPLQNDEPEDWLRANRSIDLYHLNEGSLILDRYELNVAIQHKFDEIEQLESDRKNGEFDDRKKKRYKTLIDELGEIINSSSRYCTFARNSLSQRGDRGWNTKLLLST